MRNQVRRSMLYMPGSNSRAMEKARSLDADTLIFDLEDAVAPDQKAQARALISQQFSESPYDDHEVLIRVNSVQTPWGLDDINAMAKLPSQGLVLPKIDKVAELMATIEAIDAAGGEKLPIWIMTETALGVLKAAEVYGCSERITGVILGTSDLAAEMRIPHTADRLGFLHLLSHCVISARAFGLTIIDGVHLNFKNDSEFEAHCIQGRNLGFDGKSLIHPKQIAVCNKTYSPSEEQIQHAKKIIDAWKSATEAGEGVCVVNGQLIENLHIEEAKRTLLFTEAMRLNPSK